MNFKIIFSIAVLTLAAVNASPIDEISQIKKECESYRKSKFLFDESTNEYTCLEYDACLEDVKICFNIDENKNKIVHQDYACVVNGFNNIPSCSNYSASEYTVCATKIIKMLEKDGNYRIRKFPTREKIIRGYEIDQKECLGFDGIILTNKEFFQYICLLPANPRLIKSLNDSQCVKLNGKYYFIDQDNTSIDVCNKNHKDYNYNTCKRILKEYGTVNHLDMKFYKSIERTKVIL